MIRGGQCERRLQEVLRKGGLWAAFGKHSTLSPFYNYVYVPGCTRIEGIFGRPGSRHADWRLVILGIQRTA